MKYEKLGNLCSRVCSGGTPKSSNRNYYDGGTIPWLNTKEIRFNRIWHTESCITEEGLSNSSAKWVDPNTIIVAMYGATAGKSCIAKIPLTTNQACCNLTIDSSAADYRYVYYWLVAHYEELFGLATGAAQQNLNVGMIKDLSISLPDLEVQRKIASLLSILDEKIDLNNRINDYLAEMCEVLSMKICQKPDGTLEDICTLITTKISFSDADLKTYVSTESLLRNKSGRQSASSLPASGKVVSYKKGDTLVSNIRPYFKKIWYASNNGTCSNDVLVFRAHDKNDAAYLHSILRQNDFFDYIMRSAKGTKMPRGDKKQLMTFPIMAHCQEPELAMFNSAIEGIAANEIQTNNLIELRDSLLPKLMSGEIDVSSINIGYEK